MKKIIQISFLLSLLFSCDSNKKNNLNKFQMMSLIYKADNKARDITHEKNGFNINCEMYGKGCERVYRGVVIGYEFFLIEFSEVKYARQEATKKKTLYKNNWMIDYIQKEKILMDFFKNKVGAINGP